MSMKAEKTYYSDYNKNKCIYFFQIEDVHAYCVNQGKSVFYKYTI